MELVGEIARPEVRVEILTTITEACRRRGAGEAACGAKERWANDPITREDENPDRRSYDRFGSMDEVRRALATEREHYREAKEYERDATLTSYGLRQSIARLLPSVGWAAASQFIDEEPDLARDREIALVLARMAVDAGDNAQARELAAPFIDDEAKGWDWGSGRGTLLKHEFLQASGLDRDGPSACEEFHRDIANAPYGVGSILWDVDRIFPALWSTLTKARSEIRSVLLDCADADRIRTDRQGAEPSS